MAVEWLLRRPDPALTIELIPHFTSVPRDGWTASHDVRPLTRAIGGAWAAGRMLRAVTLMRDALPGGRAAAASHGDVIPVAA